MTTLHTEVRIRLERELRALEEGFAPVLRVAHASYADAWDVVPGLEAFLETVAAQRIIDEETRVYRTSDGDALECAAKRLSLEPEALRKRIERLSERARG